MLNAARAYPGCGLSDWWYNRYVNLSCVDEPPKESCKSGTFFAYLSPTKDYPYPLVVFRPVWFNKRQSLDEAIAKVNANKDLQQKCTQYAILSHRYLMHELLHINWGTAQECRGLREGEGC